MKQLFLTAVLCLSSLLGAYGEVDPNFHIYLCFGQSNMEGNAQWESIDTYVDSRFQMLATCNFNNPSRQMGKWYTAKCPIVSPQGKLGPTDYFGRTMVAAMPADVRIGVVAVAMGGSPIEMFDKDKYQKKLKDNPNEWWAILANQYYGGNPYGRLVEMGKKAQESGVIKGILLHQGCSNCGDPNWPNMVKKIYNDLLTDLGLQAEDVPLFVGEVEYANQGGGCSSHNTVVANIPNVIPTGHVVSAEGLPGNGQDSWHFSALGYRIFGKRYAFEALKLMGKPLQKDPAYKLPDNLTKLTSVTKLTTVDNLKIRVGVAKQLTVFATFADGHKENITKTANYSSDDFTVTTDGIVTANAAKTGSVTISYTDFTGQEIAVTITVIANDPTGVGDAALADKEVSIGKHVYDLQGRRVAHPVKGLYIMKGKKVVVK